ncbi:MAG: DoxX family protein [Bacteroidota bacterium]
MTQQPSKAIHVTLWVAQAVLALSLIMGTFLKFMPIEKVSSMMPWTGQVPEMIVRLLGIVDLLGAVGLILPALLRIKPQLTPWAALCTVALMLCATIFHISRGEASVIGFNLFCIVLAAFIAWGRFKKAPIAST